MERAIIISKGKVQRAGYRDYVFEMAVELGVVGYVENQPDGIVEIVGEAKKEILENFISELKPEDDPLIKVVDLDTKYERATGEFKHFEIRRGTSDEETGERLDTAAKSLKLLAKTTAGMNENLGEKIDSGNKMLGEKIDSGNKMLGEKIDSGFGKMDNNFNRMDVKYDKMSERMESIDKTLQKLTEAILALVKSKS